MAHKNIILLVSSLYSFFVAYFLLYASVNQTLIKSINNITADSFELIFNIGLFFPFILFFSLLTYKMPARVFQAWWAFVRIAIPIVLALSFVINLGLHHRPGSFGGMNLDNIFDIPALILLYTIFIIGSLVQIYRGYHR